MQTITNQPLRLRKKETNMPAPKKKMTMKQMQLAQAAAPKGKITGADFKSMKKMDKKK